MQGKRTNLRKAGSERIDHDMRVRFNPVALLLDSSLEGELDLVQRVIFEESYFPYFKRACMCACSSYITNSSGTNQSIKTVSVFNEIPILMNADIMRRPI